VVEVLLTQRLRIVVGSEAGSKWMRDDLLMRRRQDKPVHVLQRSNHMKLYDVPKSSGRGGSCRSQATGSRPQRLARAQQSRFNDNVTGRPPEAAYLLRGENNAQANLILNHTPWSDEQCPPRVEAYSPALAGFLLELL
jgi:hypothetical protein